MIEIVYALVSSAALGAAIGLALHFAASAVGIGGSWLVDVVAVGLALGIWVGRTFLLLLRFDRSRRAAA